MTRELEGYTDEELAEMKRFYSIGGSRSGLDMVEAVDNELDARYPSEDDKPTAITISDLANHILGREAKTGKDFQEARLPMFGGCANCYASIACYNSHPSTTGYLLCSDCIGDLGYTDVETAQREIFKDEEEENQAEGDYQGFGEDYWENEYVEENNVYQL